MTRTIIIGQSEEKKKIEFVHLVRTGFDPNIEIIPAVLEPGEYDVIELIRKGLAGYFDIMFAYKDNRTKGVLYLGRWNDGVV